MGDLVTFRSSYAYPQLYYMLEHKEFKQRQMARDLGIPHGKAVSGFVNWLQRLNFVEKRTDRDKRLSVYKLPSPLALIKFYSTFRQMSDLKVSKNWGTDRNKVIEHFKSQGGVFCLTTALEHYTEYVKDPSIHVYVPEEFWTKMQESDVNGTVRVNMYSFKPYRDNNVIEKDGVKITSKLRTLIDLYCDDKSYAAEPLIRQLWP